MSRDEPEGAGSPRPTPPRPSRAAEGLRPVILVLVVIAALLGTSWFGAPLLTQPFRLDCPRLPASGTLADRYTCVGGGVSPPLTWSGAPRGTRTFALRMEELGAAGTAGRVQWLVYGIPASRTGLPSDLPRTAELADGTRQGRSDGMVVGYDAPCPPRGRHRDYRIVLIALAFDPDLAPGSSARDFERVIDGHILDRTVLEVRAAAVTRERPLALGAP